jgi:signal transduction histidine kinase
MARSHAEGCADTIRFENQTLLPKPFNLLRSFALLSLLSIGLITSLSASALLRFLTDHFLQRDAVVSMEFIQSMTKDEQLQVAFNSPELIREEEGLGELFKHIAHMPDVVRTNVYSSDGTVVWSSDQKKVGQRFTLNPDLVKAFSGELVFGLMSFGEHNKSEFTDFPEGVTEFTQNCIPIWDSGRTKVVGVIDLFKIPRILFQTLEKAQWMVWISAVVGGLFLYATLFWIVRRAGSVIRRQEERLVESETIAATAEMAASVAHSIRNSLGSIRSSAELAIEVEDPDVGRNAARDIVAEVDRLRPWLRELLLFSKTETSGFTTVNIVEVLMNSLESFKHTMEKQGIESHVDVTDPVPLVRGDIALLEQMLTSLISNALEAMPDGGRIAVNVHGIGGGDGVELTLSDTGQGIPVDQMAKVFKPFFTSKSSGLGLGLSLVRRIVERHDGEVLLFSQESRGTTVTLRFPAMRQ